MGWRGGLLQKCSSERKRMLWVGQLVALLLPAAWWTDEVARAGIALLSAQVYVALIHLEDTAHYICFAVEAACLLLTNQPNYVPADAGRRGV